MKFWDLFHIETPVKVPSLGPGRPAKVTRVTKKIYINGHPINWGLSSISYEEISCYCGIDPTHVPTVSVAYPNTHRDRDLTKGESAELIDGTSINCAICGRA